MTEHTIDGKKLEEILGRYREGDGQQLIHALQDIQAAFHYIPFDAVVRLCAHLDVPISKAFSAATFYKAFSLEPKGEVIIRICTGTACHIRGARVLVEELTKKLGIKPGGTTKDLKFTVETVNCVGACAMAPVVSINGKYHGKMGPADLLEVVGDGEAHEDR